MSRIALGAVMLAFAVCVCPAWGQVPTSFELYQNDPNPFCPASPGGYTTIPFAMPQQAYVVIQVSSPDTAVIVRTLVSAYQDAGYHEVWWDGRDESGDVLPDGAYPYTMVAADSPGGPPGFLETLVATVDCDTPAEPGTWGRLKSLYRWFDRPTPD